MKPRKRLWTASLTLALVCAAGVGRAALASATDSKVTFTAAGPAGMKIEGSTTDLGVTDDGANLVVTVPLGNLSTGIGLRDHHMKEKYLEVQKYPNAVLTVARTALKMPRSDQPITADVPGTVQIHGQTRPITVHYEAKTQGASVEARGTFHVNMNDFGITVPVYLGVTVKPDVEVSASFRATGT